MKKKVLFTASTYSHIRHFHLPYLEYYRKCGWEVHVACGGAVQDIPCADRIIALPLEKSMRSPENFRAARLLRKLIREERYSLITTHTALAAFFTRLALLGMKNRPPLVNMVHGYLFDDDTPFLRQQLLLAAERITAPCTDLLLTMNDWDYQAALQHRLGKQIQQVPGIGVDFSRIRQYTSAGRQAARKKLGVSEDAFVLLYAAEFSARKSQEVLIRAMAKLPSHVLLILAGDGVQLDACRDLAESLHLTDRISFPGYIHNIGAWYPLADAAVSASRSEGLPFNIMEAMYAGIPVVASSVKGHTDLIRDGQTGLLYPYGDSTACAEQILRLAKSPELCKALGTQARESVLSYSLDQVFPAVVDQYTSLLSLPVEPLDG